MTKTEKLIKKTLFMVMVWAWSMFIGDVVLLATGGLYNYAGPVLILWAVMLLIVSVYFTVVVYKLFKETKGMK